MKLQRGSHNLAGCHMVDLLAAWLMAGMVFHYLADGCYGFS